MFGLVNGNVRFGRRFWHGSGYDLREQDVSILVAFATLDENLAAVEIDFVHGGAPELAMAFTSFAFSFAPAKCSLVSGLSCRFTSRLPV